jgi:hypothetical protein
MGMDGFDIRIVAFPITSHTRCAVFLNRRGVKWP